MSADKRKPQVWAAVLRGVLLALSVYAAGVGLLAALVTSGTIGEGRGFVALAFAAALAAFLGGVSTSGVRSGAPTALLTAAAFAVVLACCGLAGWGRLNWDSSAAVLAAGILTGGAVSELGRRRRTKGKVVKVHKDFAARRGRRTVS